MIRQTLGISLEVFYSPRLKVLILFPSFIENVLNCFLCDKRLVVGLFGCCNKITVVTFLCYETIFEEGCCLSVYPPQDT